MKIVAVSLLIAAVALCAAPAGARSLSQAAADASTVSIQFDNSKSSVERKNAQVTRALAESVFLVPVGQVKFLTCVGQSTLGGVLGSQSVCTYRAVGPATNRRSVLANCQENTRTGLRGVLGFDSRAENAIEKATDTFIPGDKIELQKATCSQG